ncbi:MAG: hypothetical protein GY913_32735 [Proteobacteria bacterium]|nr:hypothetical protein [Pseudomonadota bacterium]
MRSTLWILGLVFFLHGCSREPRGEVFRSFQFGDTELELRATTGWAFGSHSVDFYEVSPVGRRHLGSTELHNDGASLTARNAALSTLGGGVWELTLSGQEQEPQAWLIERTTSGFSIALR